MTEAAVFDAFCVLMNTFAEELEYPETIQVAYPDVHFEPPDEGMWLEVRFFPNETDNYGIANDGGEVHKGFFQAGVCYRAASGLMQPLQLAGAVLQAFRKGTLLGPAKVDRPPWVASVLQMDDKTILPVTIPYRGFVVTEEPIVDDL